MNSKQEYLYGYPILPRRGKNNMPYELFEGIIIDRLSIDHNIEISKMLKTDKGYYTDSFIRISFDEELMYCDFSGKKLTEFLISKASSLIKNNEQIAFGDELALYLRLKDYFWLDIKYKLQNSL